MEINNWPPPRNFIKEKKLDTKDLILLIFLKDQFAIYAFEAWRTKKAKDTDNLLSR
jgi:hypothetical protein